jgi:hypothetical protein
MAKLIGSMAVVALLMTSLGQPRDARAAQLFELHASDPAASANFGLSVATAGATLVIGSPLAGLGGVVYVFQPNINTYTQTARLTPSGPNSSSIEAGFSVAYDGTTLVFGAPAGGAITAGAVYVFVQNALIWTQAAVLTASDAASLDMFGDSVSVSGSLVAVGAPAKAGGGAAYVFTGSGSTWSQQAKLVPAGAHSVFGSSIALQGTRVLVGGSGGAYVFAQSGTTWSQQAQLTPVGGTANDSFGASVSFQPSTIVVGAPDNNSSTGAAYVFTSAGTSWVQSQQLLAPDRAAFDQFGLSVATGAGTVVVGAQGHAGQRGAAYVFTQVGSSWALQQEIAGADGAGGDLFGHSVAFIGTNAVAGAPGKTGGEGAVYVFTAPGAPNPVPALGGKGVLVALALLGITGATALRRRRAG